jgi:hypothetical protein
MMRATFVATEVERQEMDDVVFAVGEPDAEGREGKLQRLI